MVYNPMHFNEYDENIINHLRKVQLMILKDFIEICDNNQIEYYSYGGTTLGAVRHGGYIPWDDDIDVILFREDYEKFLKVFNQLNQNKYSLITLDNTEDYFYFLSKFSLNGTEFKQGWTKNTNFKLGINIDIFILDHVPDNNIANYIYLKKIDFIGKILAIFIVCLNKNYPSKSKKIIAQLGFKLFNIFKITPNKIKRYYYKIIQKNNDKNYSRVFENGAVCYNQPFPINIFKPAKKLQFEDIEINVPNDYDTYLKIIYGDYMKLPPEEDRLIHEHEYIDFGKY